MSELASTYNKGFSITFPNGFRLSVQFGPGNYCEQYNESLWYEPTDKAYWKSVDAEIAVISPSGGMLPFKDENTVLGYVSVATLVKVIAYVSALTDHPGVIPFPEE